MRIARRTLAITLLAAAAALAMMPRANGDGTSVLTATRDLPIGLVLTAADLRDAAVAAPPDGAIAAGAKAATVGKAISGAVRRGEILTDARLINANGPDPGPGRVAVPIHVDDPTVVEMLGAGMRITLVALIEEPATASGRQDVHASVLTREAVVLGVPAQPSSAFGSKAPQAAIVSVPEAAADAVTAAAAMGTITIRFDP